MTIHISGPPAGLRGSNLDSRLLRSRAGRILRELGEAKSELSIALVSDPDIAELNASWRNREGPTDVLSFSMLEGEHADRRGELLGDVVIGVEAAARQAAARHRSMDEELARLLIHGVLHLLGYDHQKREQERVMKKMQSVLWKACTS
jgi:rRNA maturation RNase YbeY